MEIQEITYHAKLVAKNTDALGYTSFVFENLEYSNLDYKYIMCVMFPNWNQDCIEIGDIGYITFKYVREGIDKWFNGVEFVPYKYTNIIFLKFIKDSIKIDTKNILID